MLHSSVRHYLPDLLHLLQVVVMVRFRLERCFHNSIRMMHVMAVLLRFGYQNGLVRADWFALVLDLSTAFFVHVAERVQYGCLLAESKILQQNRLTGALTVCVFKVQIRFLLVNRQPVMSAVAHQRIVLQMNQNVLFTVDQTIPDAFLQSVDFVIVQVNIDRSLNVAECTIFNRFSGQSIAAQTDSQCHFAV